MKKHTHNLRPKYNHQTNPKTLYVLKPPQTGAFRFTGTKAGRLPPAVVNRLNPEWARKELSAFRETLSQVRKAPMITVFGQQQRRTPAQRRLPSHRDINFTKAFNLTDFSGLGHNLTRIPGTRTICSLRRYRRATLFALGIAGRGQRKSPGQGGTYRRTEDSQLTCNVVRR